VSCRRARGSPAGGGARCGPSSFATARDIQRFWRDSEVASRHALAEPEIGKQVYGRALFGMYEPISPY
jgi:3-hydroxy-9,10-secoandrosta-1,3,5(10)-triene-9,17-dione monooxygenase